MGFFSRKNKKAKALESSVLSKQSVDLSKMPSEEKTRKAITGIAFGGGGTRGFAHIGVIKALEEHNIDFDYVAGTSVGSIIGSFYASGMKFKEIYEVAMRIKESDIRNSKVFFVPSKSSNIENLVRSVIGDVVFSDLKKPFSVATVDVLSGLEVDIDSGLVARAVSGSCAVPGVFNPVDWQKYKLIDGGTTNPLPAELLKKMGAEVIVSVDINKTRGYGTEETSILKVLMASLRISMKANARIGIENSDLVIKPTLRAFNQAKLKGLDQMIEEGYESTIAVIDEIKKLVNKRVRVDKK